MYLWCLQETLKSRVNPCFLSNIRSHSRMPAISAKSNEMTDLRIMNVDQKLLEQERTLYQYVYLYPTEFTQALAGVIHDTMQIFSKNLHHLAPCLHLWRLSIGEWPKNVTPQSISQMAVTHYPSFGNLRYVHVIVNSCSSFVYAVFLMGGKRLPHHRGYRNCCVVCECCSAFEER